MEQFTIHITVGPRSKATFRLTYEEVLKRKLAQYTIDIKVKPKQLVHHFEVACRGPHAGEQSRDRAPAPRCGSERQPSSHRGPSWACAHREGTASDEELPEPASLLLSELQLIHLWAGGSCRSRTAVRIVSATERPVVRKSASPGQPEGPCWSLAPQWQLS